MPVSRFPRFIVLAFAAAAVAGCAGGAPETDPPAASVQTTSLALPWVDRPGVSHAPVRNAAGTATAQYFGGTVTANAKVYVVWWGDPSKINSAVTAAKGGIADFFAGVTNSSFMDWLNEYSTNVAVQAGSHKGMAGTGQLIGRGNYAGTLTISDIPSGDVTDAQIQTTLDQAITAGTLPAPDDNTLYAVYFPKGLTITLDGSKSCAGFGAYHDAIIETQRHNVYYLVMPDCGSSFNGMTSVSTHELVEAMTDNVPTPASSPDYPQAWNDSMGNEMGDLCNASGTVATDFGTFTVQTIWDERTQACKAFSSDAKDFSVAVSPNVYTVASNAPVNFTVKTTTSVGAAQSLTLSVVAPPGITATVSPTTIMSGATAALTITATNPSASTGLQVVVRADATSGSVVQTHTAALLLTTSSAPADLGPAPADLAEGAADLAQPPGGGDGTPPGDMSLGTGTGGGGATPPGTPKGCGCVIGARPRERARQHRDPRDAASTRLRPARLASPPGLAPKDGEVSHRPIAKTSVVTGIDANETDAESLARREIPQPVAHVEHLAVAAAERGYNPRPAIPAPIPPPSKTAGPRWTGPSKRTRSGRGRCADKIVVAANIPRPTAIDPPCDCGPRNSTRRSRSRRTSSGSPPSAGTKNRTFGFVGGCASSAALRADPSGAIPTSVGLNSMRSFSTRAE